MAIFLIIPKKYLNKKLIISDKTIKKHLPYLIIIFTVVAIHLMEVNIIDPKITSFIGHDYANDIQKIEGNIVYWFSQHWTPLLVYFFVIIYIIIYPFTLWFSILYFLITDNKKSTKTLSYGLLLIYIIALPFYLLLPITNVYTYYDVSSALENVIPSIEQFFYSTTTQNNCLPSLHTAMTILVTYCVSLTKNKKFTIFSYFVMINVIISVLYLSIHWITDVITGAALALGAIYLLNRYIKDE